MTNSPRTNDLDALPELLSRLDARRLLVITTPSRRFLPQLEARLGERPWTLFDGARVHVPEDTIAAASAALASAEADVVISLGGGSTTGLAKALRRRHERLRVVAIPTTYAGSEMTSIWGETEDGRKRTGRDPRVRPDAVLHAPALLATLPRAQSVTSLLNALAHPISALAAAPLTGELRARALNESYIFRKRVLRVAQGLYGRSNVGDITLANRAGTVLTCVPKLFDTVEFSNLIARRVFEPIRRIDELFRPSDL